MLTHLATLASTSTPHPISYGQATILGVIQGIAEPFPISSLGQTVLWPSLFGWQSVVKAQSNPESFWLAFVVALHVGNAVALVLYFLRDWVVIVKAWLRSISRRRIENPTERLAWLIVTASIPAGILGLLLEHPLRVALAKPLVAAFFLMLNGCMLFGAERLRRRDESRQAAAALAVSSGPGAAPVAAVAGGQRLDALNFKEAGALGVAQSTALVAGISREGVVMTAGLVRGLTHENAARFAFLMAAPIILAAGVFKLPDLFGHLGNGVRGQALVGAIVAGVVSLFAIRFLLRFFKSKNLNPFGAYCLAFGMASAIYLAS